MDGNCDSSREKIKIIVIQVLIRALTLRGFGLPRVRASGKCQRSKTPGMAVPEEIDSSSDAKKQVQLLVLVTI